MPGRRGQRRILRRQKELRPWWGQMPSTGQTRRVVKTGRNESCPCGSGRKYKRCCGDSADPAAPAQRLDA